MWCSNQRDVLSVAPCGNKSAANSPRRADPAVKLCSVEADSDRCSEWRVKPNKAPKERNSKIIRFRFAMIDYWVHNGSYSWPSAWAIGLYWQDGASLVLRCVHHPHVIRMGTLSFLRVCLVNFGKHMIRFASCLSMQSSRPTPLCWRPILFWDQLTGKSHWQDLYTGKNSLNILCSNRKPSSLPSYTDS